MKKLLFIALFTALTLTACNIKPSEDEIVRILFVGDTDFGESYGGVDLDERGYTSSFENFRGIMERADYVVANLEGTLTDVAKSPFVDEKTYIHSANPIEAGPALKEVGIDAVSLANNHAYDFGDAGLKQTLETLDQNEIEYFGAGLDEIEAAEPIVKEFRLGDKTFRVAIIGAFQYEPSYANDYQFYAGENKSGVNLLDDDAVEAQIAQLDEQYPGIYTVVFPHWGRNYRWKNPEQVNHAARFIDAGADFVIGHGAHMLQEVEKLGSKWISYGLGNFVFNSPGRYEEEGREPISLIMEMRFENDPDADFLWPILRFYPIFTDNRETDYMSRFATKSEFDYAWSETFKPGRSGKDEFGYYFEVRRED